MDRKNGDCSFAKLMIPETITSNPKRRASVDNKKLGCFSLSESFGVSAAFFVSKFGTSTISDLKSYPQSHLSADGGLARRQCGQFIAQLALCGITRVGLPYWRLLYSKLFIKGVTIKKAIRRPIKIPNLPIISYPRKKPIANVTQPMADQTFPTIRQFAAPSTKSK